MNLGYSILVTTVWFLSTYFNIVLLLILFNKKSEIYKYEKISSGNIPKVSMIVPCYNEEKTIEQSIKSLQKVDYPKDKFEIVIVNDGSTDSTAKIAEKYAAQKNIVFIDNKVNAGKAACLNQGILSSTGEFVACMDADTEVNPDVIKKTIPFFRHKKTGAVTVSVEVKKPATFLEKIIEIEYTIGLSLALKALSFFNAVHVTPGPFSIYRRKVLDEIGMFDTKNITEDLEIAYRIQKSKYSIACCSSTHVKTVIPKTFKGLYTQRKRWYTGSLLTLWQHKDIVLNSKVGAFAYIMPYTYLLIILGLSLIIFSIFLSLSNFIKSISHFALTNFNFWSYITLENFDILTFSSLSFFGITAIMMTILGAFLCLKIADKKIRARKKGLFGFVFLFFLYQLFWAVSIYSVIFRKTVKWR
ncbi:glycosyltransferase [Candidatus Woesearchaeota archaeon]|nr:glycosyltransferase [Candidatus Woesearchaeota archaeon]